MYIYNLPQLQPEFLQPKLAETRRPKASVRQAEIAILPTGSIVAKRLEGAKDVDHLKLSKASIVMIIMIMMIVMILVKMIMMMLILLMTMLFLTNHIDFTVIANYDKLS